MPERQLNLEIELRVNARFQRLFSRCSFGSMTRIVSIGPRMIERVNLGEFIMYKVNLFPKHFENMDTALQPIVLTRESKEWVVLATRSTAKKDYKKIPTDIRVPEDLKRIY